MSRSGPAGQHPPQHAVAQHVVVVQRGGGMQADQRQQQPAAERVPVVDLVGQRAVLGDQRRQRQPPQRDLAAACGDVQPAEQRLLVTSVETTSCEGSLDCSSGCAEGGWACRESRTNSREPDEQP